MRALKGASFNRLSNRGARASRLQKQGTRAKKTAGTREHKPVFEGNKGTRTRPGGPLNLCHGKPTING